MRLLGIRSRTRQSTFYLIYHIFYFPIGKIYFYFCDLGSPSGGNVKWRTRQEQMTAGQATFLLMCAVETTHINIAMCYWVCVSTYMHARTHTHTHTRTHTKKPRRRRRYSGLRYRLDNRGIVVKFPAWAKTSFLRSVRTDSDPHGLLIGVSRGIVPPGKAVGMLTTYPPSSAKVKNNRTHISTNPHAFMACTRKTLLHLISYTHITYNLP
jgi:hypothetical protein